jgi:hypothetical protein
MIRSWRSSDFLSHSHCGKSLRCYLRVNLLILVTNGALPYIFQRNPLKLRQKLHRRYSQSQMHSIDNLLRCNGIHFYKIKCRSMFFFISLNSLCLSEIKYLLFLKLKINFLYINFTDLRKTGKEIKKNVSGLLSIYKHIHAPGLLSSWGLVIVLRKLNTDRQRYTPDIGFYSCNFLKKRTKRQRKNSRVVPCISPLLYSKNPLHFR